MSNSDLQSKRLLILGGAAQCKKAVEAARELGLYVIVADRAPNKETGALADEIVQISLTDYEGLLAWCRENPVDGILNYNVDAAQCTYQRLCEALNKPCFGNAYQYHYLTDKNAFKQMCAENGVDTIRNFTEADAENGNVEFPVLIKPAQSSGSRGSAVCRNQEELLAALKQAREISLDGHAVIEKYMGGYPDFSVEYVIADGHPYLIRTIDRYLGKIEDGLNRQCIGAICPSIYTNLYLENVNDKVIAMLKKLGIRNGPVFFQGFVDGNTVRFYDPGFRFPGSEYERIFMQATGINIPRPIVRFAISNEPVSIENITEDSYMLNGKIALQLFVTSRPGKIAVFSGLDEIRKNPNVVYFAQKAFEGSEIPKSGDVKQRIAEIALLVDNDEKVISDTLSYVYSTLKVLDEHGENMLVSQFEYKSRA